MEAVALIGMVIGLAIVALTCAIAGAIIGGTRESASAGFAAGLLLGPLGVLAAFRFDGRSRCPKCMERHFQGASVCPACRHALR